MISAFLGEDKFICVRCFEIIGEYSAAACTHLYSLGSFFRAGYLHYCVDTVDSGQRCTFSAINASFCKRTQTTKKPYQTKSSQYLAAFLIVQWGKHVFIHNSNSGDWGWGINSSKTIFPPHLARVLLCFLKFEFEKLLDPNLASTTWRIFHQKSS